jgi:hypothetical protein
MARDQDNVSAIIGGVCVGSFTTLIVVMIIVVARRRRHEVPPKVAGTPIPQCADTIDFTKRYDIVYVGDYHSRLAERIEGARIIGYVGREYDPDASKFGYMRNRWLVVERPDGRKSFILPEGIQALHES